MEKRRPLRRSVEPKLAHSARNLTVAGVAAVALMVAEKPVTARLTKLSKNTILVFLKSSNSRAARNFSRRRLARLYALFVARFNAQGSVFMAFSSCSSR
jgi:hypothetical protein